MVTWELLDAECDEETQQAGDVASLTSLYEVVKLAYLQPEEQVVGLPAMYASAGWGQVAVAVDNTLFVLGEGCSSLLLQLVLEAHITLVLWVPQGEFLIMGDAAGGVHYVHVPSRKLLITKQLPIKEKKGKLFVGGQCCQTGDGTLMVRLVTTGGQVISLENIDNEALSEGLRAGDVEALKALESQISFSVDTIGLEEVKVLRRYLRLITATTCVGCGALNKVAPTLWAPSSLQDPQCALTWSLTHHPACHHVLSVWDNRYLVTLSSDGSLAVVCSLSGLTLWEGDANGPRILDITLLQEDQDCTQFLLLLRDPDTDRNLLQIVSFPGFAPVYELAVNGSTCLVSLGEGAESIMFLEPEVSCVSGVTRNLKIKSIVDGVPEARLAKLLVKRKFMEAEEFCKRFQLNVEEVFKAKARYLCDLLNPWQHSQGMMATLTFTDLDSDTSLTEELLNALDKIQDAEFVTTTCVEAPMTDLATTKKIFSYVKERLARTTQSEEGDKLSDLMQRVSESSYRLRTFETIFPSSNIQHWLAFSHTDMLEECVEHLSRVRAECLLECLRVAPVPWSQGTQAGCELGLSLNTSLSSQLKEQRNMVGLKLVLRKYSLHMNNIYDVKNAKMILRSILRHDEASVMVDAMYVVNTYKHLSQVDAYFFRAVHLLTTRNTDGIEKLLLDLNENIQKQICQRLVTFITETLLLTPRGKKGRDLHLAVTEGVMTLQVVLRRWVEPAGPAGGQDLFSAASCLHTLQVPPSPPTLTTVAHVC